MDLGASVQNTVKQIHLYQKNRHNGNFKPNTVQLFHCYHVCYDCHCGHGCCDTKIHSHHKTLQLFFLFLATLKYLLWLLVLIFLDEIIPSLVLVSNTATVVELCKQIVAWFIKDVCLRSFTL